MFQNPTRLIANIWADLLVGEGARYQKSFETVVFAIKDGDTFEEFKQAFAKKVATVPTATATSGLNGEGTFIRDSGTK